MVITAGAVEAVGGASDLEAEHPASTRIANVEVRTLIAPPDIRPRV
jgi:hypothetical protein